ncbi:hypothetical protein [Actinomadura chokoriensis]|uniref:Uncharacterized protein n=1 Tax=Actinomadura chokoriensis TaxID=454156 RepID=A0ABV4RAV8_9ACTN
MRALIEQSADPGAEEDGMTPYGEIHLNLDKRLALSTIDAPGPSAES